MDKHTASQKYINAILFLCQKLGGSIVGKKKLFKLLYYIDFDNYEHNETMESITGNTYIAWKMGPVPSDKGKILEQMIADGIIEKNTVHFSDTINDAEKYTAKQEPDMSLFSNEEISIMERVVKKYGQLSGKQLETLTHAEAPYLATGKNEPIEYGLAFYRETDFNDLATA